MGEAVGRALAAGDLEATADAAHKLAGAVSNLHAWPTREAALEVEREAERGDLAATREAHEHLRAAFDRLLQSVAPSRDPMDTPLEQG
jgi:HPt (histidine-containing phosphotransfer) domain-containing protein